MVLYMSEKENTLQKEIEKLNAQIVALQTELTNAKDRLKTYTSPKRSKDFYKNHRDEILQKVKEYRERTDYVANISPEKRKQYNRAAYLNRKLRLSGEP